MPYIEAKVSLPLTKEQKEELKCGFGQTMSLIGKSESYLMVNIEDKKDIWFAGKKLEKGAYVSLSLLGNSTRENYEKVTKAVCDLLEKALDIDPKGVYVTYHPVTDWGWSGANF